MSEPICPVCKRRLGADAVVHHRLPIWHPDSYMPGNLMLVHRLCLAPRAAEDADA